MIIVINYLHIKVVYHILIGAKKHYCSITCLCESNRKYEEYHSKKIKDIQYGVVKKSKRKKDVLT